MVIFCAEGINGFNYVIGVQQGFTHSHEDNIGDLVVGIVLRYKVVEGIDLSGNFSGAEIPPEPHIACSAKRALKRTPNLG